MIFSAFVLIVFLLIGGVIGLWSNFWYGLAFFLASSSIFIYQGLQYIPASPPHKGAVTFLGERTGEVKKEGWRFFPFYPYLYGFIPVKVEKINQDFKPENVRTPDRAGLDIQASVTFTPTDLIEYINAGGEQGVKNILDDIVPERIREWAFSEDEGPQDWQEAQGSREDAIAVLLKAIVGESLTQIPEYAQVFPTTVWLKYFDSPRKKIIKKRDIDAAGENWEKIERFYESLSLEEQEELKDAIDKRRIEVNQARSGNGKFSKSILGITINRLNIPKIEVRGEVAKTADLEAQEIQERKGEIFEVNTDVLKAHQLMNAAKEKGESLTLQDAYRIIMEWKTTREGHGFTIPGISPAITQLAQVLLGRR